MPSTNRQKKTSRHLITTRALIHDVAVALALGSNIGESVRLAKTTREFYQLHRDDIDTLVMQKRAEITQQAIGRAVSHTIEAVETFGRNLTYSGMVVDKNGDEHFWPDGKVQNEAAKNLVDLTIPKSSRLEITGKDGGPITLLGLIKVLDASKNKPTTIDD